MLTRVASPVAQLRLVRGQLRRFTRSTYSHEDNTALRYFVYSLAYIERAPSFDRLSLRLEQQAMRCLFASGVRPPKSQLSHLFTDLFHTRVIALTRAHAERRTGRVESVNGRPPYSQLHRQNTHDTSANPLLLYAALCHYCNDKYLTPSAMPTVLVKPRRPIIQDSDCSAPALRRYRFSGELALAKRLAKQSTSAHALGERVLIHGQIKGSLYALDTQNGGALSQDQLDEWWLLAYSVASRRWVNSLPEQASVSPRVWDALNALKGFYGYDQPLLLRLYDYVRFQLERRIDNPLLDMYFSAACLRWLFRSNQVTFARQEACRYQALSRVISRGATLDALGVMGDVLARLFPV